MIFHIYSYPCGFLQGAIQQQNIWIFSKVGVTKSKSSPCPALSRVALIIPKPIAYILDTPRVFFLFFEFNTFYSLFLILVHAGVVVGNFNVDLPFRMCQFTPFRHRWAERNHLNQYDSVPVSRLPNSFGAELQAEQRKPPIVFVFRTALSGTEPHLSAHWADAVTTRLRLLSLQIAFGFFNTSPKFSFLWSC